MAFIRRSQSGNALVETYMDGGRRRERCVCWLGDALTLSEAADLFRAALTEAEARAADLEAYGRTRDGLNDKGARWDAHQLQKRITKLKGQLAAVEKRLNGDGDGDAEIPVACEEIPTEQIADRRAHLGKVPSASEAT